VLRILQLLLINQQDIAKQHFAQNGRLICFGTVILFFEEIVQPQFGDRHEIGFQGLSNQLAPKSHPGIVDCGCRVANEVYDRRLLPLGRLLCFAGFQKAPDGTAA
jgi:hypothetical protein